MNTQQALAVSSLLAIAESLVENRRLTVRETIKLSQVVEAVREAFRPRLPTLIIADPEFDAVVDRVAAEMGADA